MTAPTTGEWITRATNDLAARLRTQHSRIRRSWLWYVGRTAAKAAGDLASFITWSTRQLLPDLAARDRLDMHGDIYGVTRDVATKATSATVRFTGVVATPIPAGTLIAREDGWQYETDVLTAIGADTTVDVACTSVLTGAGGNLEAGGLAALVTPIAGVDDGVASIDGFVGGADEQADPSYRRDVLDRIRDVPEGGHEDHWLAWVREALPTAAAVWLVRPGDVAAPAPNANTRTLYFLVRDTGAGTIPTAGNVATVQAYLATVRPLCFDATAAAPTEDAITVTVDLEPGAAPTDTPERRAAVVLELAELLLRRAGDRAAGGTLTIANSEIRSAIGRGAPVFTVTDVNGGGPLADVTIAAGAAPTLGGVTFA